jgi:hypothetical protein
LLDRYVARNRGQPTTSGELTRIEERLGVVLPRDLKQIATTAYAGAMLACVDMYATSAESTGWSIVDATLALRDSVGLPNRYVVLAEPPESVILLETRSEEGEPAPVLWLDIADAHRLLTGEAVEGEGHQFPTYADFFAYLLQQDALEA